MSGPPTSGDSPILVTGGGGFLGGFVVRRLRADGRAVRALSRRALPVLDRLGVEVVRGDLEDRASVLAACDGVGGVVHAAAKPGIHAPMHTFRGPNVTGTRHVIDGVLTRRVPALVHVSSPSVVFDGSPHAGANESLPLRDRGLGNYAHSKLLAERDVLRADRVRGVRTLAVRPHLIWGPGDRHVLPALVAAAKRGRVPAVGDADPQIAPTYVENAAAACVRALDALLCGREVGGRAYFVNDLPAVRLFAFVRRVAEEAGLPVPAKRMLPAGLAAAAGRAGELLGRGDEPPLSRFAVAQLAVPHWYDTAAADRLGDWHVVGIDEAWRRTRPFLRELAAANPGAAESGDAD